MQSIDHDLIIVGAGPSGLACAIEASEAGLNYLVIEKGGITDAIRRFPTNMTFFSTPELLELGGLPFSTTNVRPTRVEALEYYRRVVTRYELQLRLHRRVTRIHRDDDGAFTVDLRDETYAGFDDPEHPAPRRPELAEPTRLRSRKVIVATGYFDYTNRLNVPGEDLPHVSHYYDEAYRYAGCNVLVVGGRNSAVEAALDLFRHDARVTLVHRRPELADSVKYWIMPDIRNRLKEGSIAAHFNAEVEAIRPHEVDVRNTVTGEARTVLADVVFPLIGYRPDEALLREAGVQLNEILIPEYDEGSFETNVPGLYIAGSVACGCETWNIFIENGRAHARPIFAHLLENL